MLILLLRRVASGFPKTLLPAASLDVILSAGILVFGVAYDFLKLQLRFANQFDTFIPHLSSCRSSLYTAPAQSTPLSYCVRYKTFTPIQHVCAKINASTPTSYPLYPKLRNMRFFTRLVRHASIRSDTSDTPRLVLTSKTILFPIRTKFFRKMIFNFKFWLWPYQRHVSRDGVPNIRRRRA